MESTQQLALAFTPSAPAESGGLRPAGPSRRGGRRAGAGRRREPGRPVTLPHRARPRHHHRHPVHVTMRARVSGLRSRDAMRVVHRALARFRRAPRDASFRIVEFSVQSNHIHLIVEADDNRELTAGLRGLAVSLARRLNKLFARGGTFWTDRYHARALGSPRAVRNALAYVLHSARKHGAAAHPIDECSSGAWFGGWRRDAYWAFAIELGPIQEVRAGPCVVSAPRTWLAKLGWQRGGGPIGLDEVPGYPRAGARRRGLGA